MEVGIRIELITVEQCYGVAVHPLTIRATDQFLFSAALFGFEPVQPTEWARLTVLHYGLESIIWLQHALIDSPIRTVK